MATREVGIKGAFEALRAGRRVMSSSALLRLNPAGDILCLDGGGPLLVRAYLIDGGFFVEDPDREPDLPPCPPGCELWPIRLDNAGQLIVHLPGPHGRAFSALHKMPSCGRWCGWQWARKRPDGTWAIVRHEGSPREVWRGGAEGWFRPIDANDWALAEPPHYAIMRKVGGDASKD